MEGEARESEVPLGCAMEGEARESEMPSEASCQQRERGRSLISLWLAPKFRRRWVLRKGVGRIRRWMGRVCQGEVGEVAVAAVSSSRRR